MSKGCPITETKRILFRFHETILRFGDWIPRAVSQSLIQPTKMKRHRLQVAGHSAAPYKVPDSHRFPLTCAGPKSVVP